MAAFAAGRPDARSRANPRVVHVVHGVLLCILLIGVGAARIIGTYSIFSLTWDERFHLGAGMEWLADGRYTYEAKHVPRRS